MEIRRVLLYFFLILHALFLSHAWSSDFSEALSKGDAAFKERKDEKRAREAFELYEQAIAKSPQDPEALWRLSMACHFIGMRLSTTDAEKIKYFERGRESGLQSLNAGADCVPCHFWTAINEALLGETKGAFKMLFTLKEIQNHLKLSSEMDPNYAEGGAFRILGIIQQKLPGILGGSNDEAKKYYQAAIASAPAEPLNYLFLVRLLREEYGDNETAKKTAERALAFPSSKDEYMESQEARVELKEILSGLSS